MRKYLMKVQIHKKEFVFNIKGRNAMQWWASIKGARPMPFNLKILTVDQTWSNMILDFSADRWTSRKKMLCMYESAGQTFKFWTIRLLIKVQIFWEGHKHLRNLPHGFDIYLVKVQLFWKGHKNLKKSPTCFEATE